MLALNKMCNCLCQALIGITVLLLCSLFSHSLAIAAQKPAAGSCASPSRGWFSFLPWFSAPSEMNDTGTLGHGQGIGARQIAKIIFPGIYLPENDDMEGEYTGKFVVEHVQTKPGLEGLEYRGFMLKPAPFRSDAHMYSAGTSRLMVWFHGNSELASQVICSATDMFVDFGRQDSFRKDNWSVLIVEYPGFGKSEGMPQAYVLEDMIEQWNRWLQESAYQGHKITVFGRSIGTAMAAYWAARYKSDGLIMDAPYSSIADIAASKMPIPGLSYLIGRMFRNTLETESFIHRVQVPTLLITRGKDWVIPEALGIAQYQAIKKTNPRPTIHVSIRLADHNNFYNFRDAKSYYQNIAKFLSDF